MTDNDRQLGKDEGLIIGELKAINLRLDNIDNSFSEFRVGVGTRLEKVENQEFSCKLNVVTEITEIKEKQKNLIGNVKDLIYSRNWVIVIIILAVATAVLKSVIK